MIHNTHDISIVDKVPHQSFQLSRNRYKYIFHVHEKQNGYDRRPQIVLQDVF